MLEPPEFTRIPEKAAINPCRLRFAQGAISRDFQNTKHGTVYDLAEGLASGKVKAGVIPAVEIGEFGSMIWSFDTRRLVAFQMARKLLMDKGDWEGAADLLITYEKLSAGEVIGRLANFSRAGSCSGLQCAIRLGGKHATQIHMFRNPEEAGISGSYMTRAEYEQNIAAKEHMSEAEYLSNVRILEKVSGGPGSYP